MGLFNAIAGASSILGLVASLWAVVEVRRLRQRYVLHVRVPQYADRLDDHTAILTTLVGEVDADPTVADSEVARLRATLKSLSTQIAPGNRQEVSAVLSLVAQVQPVRSRRDIQTLRARIVGLSQYLNLLVEDDPWT